MRAVDKYDVNVIGLTLSHNQLAHIEQRFAESDSPRSKDVRLQPWEDFDEPVDRIVSIGAFEHFGFEKYADYLRRSRRARLSRCGRTGTPSDGIPRDVRPGSTAGTSQLAASARSQASPAAVRRTGTGLPSPSAMRWNGAACPIVTVTMSPGRGPRCRPGARSARGGGRERARSTGRSPCGCSAW